MESYYSVRKKTVKCLQKCTLAKDSFSGFRTEKLTQAVLSCGVRTESMRKDKFLLESIA
jgi:hypothetical protein